MDNASHIRHVIGLRFFSKRRNDGQMSEGYTRMPLLTVAYVGKKVGDEAVFGTGITVCSTQEMPSRVVGRQKATGRALSAIEHDANDPIKRPEWASGIVMLADENELKYMEQLRRIGIVSFDDSPAADGYFSIKNLGFCPRTAGTQIVPEVVRGFLIKRLAETKEPASVSA